MRRAPGCATVPGVSTSTHTLHLDALRAAIGGGVVAPLELVLQPAAQLTAGRLTWSWEHGHRVLHAWRTWTAELPADVTTVARLVRVPHLPGVAPALRGRAVVAVDVALLGEPARAAERLAPLRRLEPELDTVAPVPVADLLARRDGDAVEGARAIGEHVVLSELPAAAVDAFVAVAGPGSRTPLVSAELLHRGRTDYAMVGVGVAADDDEEQRVRIGLEQLVRRLAPWAAGSGTG